MVQALGSQKVATLDWPETIHILLQVEREIDAELRNQNNMGKFAEKAKFVTDVMKETENKLVSQLDEVLSKLQNDIPAQAKLAFAVADEVVNELGKGVEDFSVGLQHLSNSAGNSEASQQGSGDAANKADPQKQ